MVLAWALRIRTRHRSLHLVFVALATLGTGEHYFIDLVVAVSFALLMESLFAYELPIFDNARLRAVTFGLFSTGAWLAALRFTPHVFWSTPILSWTLCATTVAIGLYLEMHLRDSGKSATRLAPRSPDAKFELPKSPQDAPPPAAETDSTPVLAEIPKL